MRRGEREGEGKRKRENNLSGERNLPTKRETFSLK
jgi:hypothetical protein